MVLESSSSDNSSIIAIERVWKKNQIFYINKKLKFKKSNTFQDYPPIIVAERVY